jgi:hypothetical protein
MDSDRKEFEAKYPMPVNAIWVGGRYAATEYDAWEVSAHQARWEGWQASAAQSRAECEALRTALADLGVTPGEAKAGAERSRANKQDAERYRWLRDMDMLDQPSVDMANAFKKYTGSALDEAIDAAMGKAKA